MPAERRLGPYRLLDHLASGGMGMIWRAEDTRLGRTVAVKLLPPDLLKDERSKERFLQEARTASSLDHPNICSIYEVTETAEHVYLVMPCYEGETLEDRIARGPLPIPEVIDFALQAATGLGKAHQRGIVHRDVKPANLMVTGDGILKILDFGIAKLAEGEARHTRIGFVAGTPAYMSPEQMRGLEVDGRTDLWSLGVVMYEMLTGRHPFGDRGDRRGLDRAAILRDEPEPLARLRPGIPADLGRLVADLLKRDPAARVPSADVLADRLRALADRPAPVRRLWTGLMAAGLILVGALGPPRVTRIPVSTAGVSLAPAALPADRPSVAVLGFRGLSEGTAQQWLGPALTEMMTAELAAGGKVRVVSSERTASARQSLNLSQKSELAPSLLEKLHALVGADLAVTGTYLPLGSPGNRRIRLDLRILTMPEGDTVASVVEVGSEPELFDLVAKTGSRLREVLGISLPSEQERLQARGLLPAGSDALRLYSEALSRLRSFDPAGARALLLQAETLEPGSAVIQSALSEAWSMSGQDEQAHEAALRAFQNRQSLPEEARLATEARFHETEKQWDQASEIYRSLAALQPDELEYGLKLANSVSMSGRGLEALAVLTDLRKRPAPSRDDPRIDILEATVAWRLSDFSRMESFARAAVAKSRRLSAGLLTARGLVYRAHFERVNGRTQEAAELLRQAEELALQAGDRWTAGRVEGNLGAVLHQQGRLEEAEKIDRQSLDVARELGSAVGTLSQLYALGEIQQDRGNLEEARALLEESLDWARRMNYGYWQAQVENLLGPALLAQGDPAGARQRLTESLAIARQIRNQEIEVLALHGLAALSLEEGDPAAARRLLDEALALLVHLRLPRLSAGTLASSADLLARMGDPALARRRLLQAQAVERRAGHRIVSGRLLGIRADFAFRAGNLGAARAASEEQLRLARECGARPLEAVALRGLARVSRVSGETARARELLQEALRISTSSGNLLAAEAARVDLARLDLDEGNFDSALTLARQAAAWYQARNLIRGRSEALTVLAEAQRRIRTATRS